MYISVVGAAECDERVRGIAYAVGCEIARRGHVLVCGGLGGVMDAAARGACEAGGVTVGILPGADRSRASKWLTVALPTDMGHARNALVALSGDALVAVCGGYGTLSEIALGLKMGKPVVGIETWELDAEGREQARMVTAREPGEAVALAEELCRGPAAHRPDQGVD